MIRYHNINGKLVEVAKSRVEIGDVGLLRGYGIFDFFPIRGGFPLFEEDYFDRFYRSARLMSIPVPVDRAELHERVVRLAEVNGVTRAYTKLVLTGGSSPDGFTPRGSNLYILQHPDVSYNQDDYEKGIALLLQDHGREHPEIKTLNYANVLQYQDILKREGALDILYHDGNHIHETSRANFFLIDSKGRIRTSVDTALGGITRKHVIKVARDNGYEVIEGPLPLYEVPHASEAFITSTTKNVLPVTRINRLMIGNGQVGDISRNLFSLFEKYMKDIVAKRSIATHNR